MGRARKWEWGKWIVAFILITSLGVSYAGAIDTTPTLTPIPTPTEATRPFICIGTCTETATAAAVTTEGIFLVDNCTVIRLPGYYLLTRSIWESTATVCIEIMEDNVIFDGGGYTIDGIDTVPTIGIRNFKASGHYQNITIKNAIVTDWGNGIQVKILEHGVIENNTVTSNDVGIHVNVLSTDNHIANNTIMDNTLAGIMFESNTNSNVIYNNYFNNINNTAFIYSGNNIWNISPLDGTNIIGGPKLGGNYWDNPQHTGFSKTCNCTGEGLCDEDYLVEPTGNNIDHAALCVPGISITGTNLMYDWIQKKGSNIYPEAILLEIYCNGGWRVDATSDNSGKLTGIISHDQLMYPMAIRVNKTPLPSFRFLPTINNLELGSGIASFYIDLEQTVQPSDEPPFIGEVYQLNITFTATMT